MGQRPGTLGLQNLTDPILELELRVKRLDLEYYWIWCFSRIVQMRSPNPIGPLYGKDKHERSAMKWNNFE